MKKRFNLKKNSSLCWFGSLPEIASTELCKLRDTPVSQPRVFYTSHQGHRPTAPLGATVPKVNRTIRTRISGVISAYCFTWYHTSTSTHIVPGASFSCDRRRSKMKFGDTQRYNMET